MNAKARRRWHVTGWALAVLVAGFVFWASQSVLPAVFVGALVGLALDQ